MIRKKRTQKLSLSSDTLRRLDLVQVVGGELEETKRPCPTVTNTHCPSCRCL